MLRRVSLKVSAVASALTTIWAEAETTTVSKEKADETLRALRRFRDFVTAELDRASGIR
jgi:hypothetical protein